MYEHRRLPPDRLQEVRVERRGNTAVVESYLIGASALIERLHAWTLIRPIRRMLRPAVYASYLVPWHQLDLSDPAAPRLMVAKGKLKRTPKHS